MKLFAADKRWTTILRRILIVSAIVLTSGGGQLSAAESGILKIGGTGGAVGAMKVLAAAFQKKHPGVAVNFIPHLGTRGGINGVQKGVIDIGLAGRRLTPEELAHGLQEIEYARSPLVFATRRNGGRNNLTYDLIAGIYRGEIRQWSDGTAVRPILRPEGDIDMLILKTISPAMRDAVSRAESREGMTVAMDDQENCDLLENVKGSFGTAALTQIIAEKRALAILPLNGVSPDITAMINGSYPHFRTFHLVTGPGSSPLAKPFIEFVKSPAGRKLLTQTGNHVPEGR